MGRSTGRGKTPLTGVRSPPLRGGASLGRMASRGKGRIWREGRFPRRGAVSAPAWQGHTQAEAYHLRRSVDDMPVA